MSASDVPPTVIPENLATLLPASLEATYNPARTLSAAPTGDDALAATAPLADPGDSATRVAISVPPPAGMPAMPEDAAKRADYALLKIIGAGGMGEVWEAEQRSLNRIVAVKRLSPRLESQRGANPLDALRLREEFRREALISARLEHPNIVPVHDRGLDEEGGPLLAMKRVHGRPWSEMLRDDFAAMPEGDYLRKHLAILQQMTLAVAFAHSKGIVHRDLKPSQVMVGEFGEVLLMDWGLAFFTGENPIDADWVLRTGVTRQETASNPSGTVAYMAPEQTEQKPDGLGTWTDVYLLGATLYNVLTGTHPHRGPSPIIAFERARRGAVEAPSARAPERRIPAELEAICLRAMAAAPDARYGSARAFYDAIDAYQSGATRREESRAISARIEDTAAALASYGDFSAALAEVQRARQLWPENPALDPLEARLLLANAELAAGEGDLRLAALLAGRLPQGEPRAKVESRIRAMEAERAARERQRRTLMVASFAFLGLLVVAGAGFLWQSERSRRAIESERNRAVAAESEAQRQRTEALAARDASDASRAESEELVSFMVKDLAARLEELGRLDILDAALDKIGDQLDARAKRTLTPREREAMGALLDRIGDTRLAQGKIAEAEEVISRALSMAQAAAAAEPESAKAASTLGTTWARVGNVRLAKGDYDGAMAAMREFETHAERAFALQPDSASLKYDLSVASGFVAQVMMLLGRKDEAAAGYARMGARLEELLATDPSNADWRRDLGVSLTMRATLLYEAKDFAAAAPAFAQGLEVMRGLLAEDTSNTLLMRDVSANWLMRGHTAKELGDLTLAEECFRETHRISRELVQIEPANLTWRSDYSKAIQALGRLLRDTSRSAEGAGLYREGIDFFRGLLASAPADGTLAYEAADMALRLGNTLRNQGQREEARAAYREGIAVLEALPERSEEAEGLLADLRGALDPPLPPAGS